MIEIVNDFNEIKEYVIENLDEYNDKTKAVLVDYINNIQNNKEIEVLIDKHEDITGLLAYNPSNYQISLYVGNIDDLINYLIYEARKHKVLKISVNTINRDIFNNYGFMVDNEIDILDMHYFNMSLIVKNSLIDKEVNVIVDKPYGSLHSFYPDEIYTCNGGYVLIDDDYYEAYVYGINEPVDDYQGKVIGIIYHEDNSEYLIVSKDLNYDKNDVINTIAFEQQHYNIIIEWSK